MDTENVQQMFINIGIRKTQNTYDSLFGSGAKLLFTFLSLRFFDMRRERYNFLLCWLFHLTPPRAAPRGKRLIWPRRAPKIDLLRPSPNLNSCVESQLTVFSNSKILSSSLQAWRHSRPRSHFLNWGFYCDICDCHILPARV